MRQVQRKIEKERLRAVLLDEMNRLAQHQIREELPVLKDLSAVAVQIVHTRARPMEEMRKVINAPAHMPEGKIEALRRRHCVGGVAEMPFAHVRGGVTGCFEHLSHSDFAGRQTPLAVM